MKDLLHREINKDDEESELEDDDIIHPQIKVSSLDDDDFDDDDFKDDEGITTDEEDEVD